MVCAHSQTNNHFDTLQKYKFNQYTKQQWKSLHRCSYSQAYNMPLHALTHSKLLHPNSVHCYSQTCPSKDKCIKLMKHAKHVKAKENFQFLSVSNFCSDWLWLYIMIFFLKLELWIEFIPPCYREYLHLHHFIYHSCWVKWCGLKCEPKS